MFKKKERERGGERRKKKKKKNLGEKYQQLTLFGCFVSFPRRLEPLSLPQLCLAAGVSWSLTWMASETTQSSPWLELISYVQLKNPMHTHKRSEPSRFLLISFLCFLPQIQLFIRSRASCNATAAAVKARGSAPAWSRAGRGEALRCQAGKQTCEKWPMLDNNKCGL